MAPMLSGIGRDNMGRLSGIGGGFLVARGLYSVGGGGGWGERTRTLIPWRQGFRHPTRNECMHWFAQI